MVAEGDLVAIGPSDVTEGRRVGVEVLVAGFVVGVAGRTDADDVCVGVAGRAVADDVCVGVVSKTVDEGVLMGVEEGGVADHVADARVVGVIDGTGVRVEVLVGGLLGLMELAAVLDGVREDVRDGVREEVRDGVRKEVRDGVRDDVRDGVREDVRVEVRDGVGGAPEPQLGGKNGGVQSHNPKGVHDPRPLQFLIGSQVGDGLGIVMLDVGPSSQLPVSIACEPFVRQ
mmetsp:Transcript_30268/g.48917  ORF Transcript_30268/g.48917 Transcript_30268/m.48917 type:complete len:229 (-) Transcript_30268:639-1325(-)